MQVSVTIINSNSRQLTLECLDSVYKQTTGVEFDVILVDNNSSDGSVEAIKEKFPNIKLVLNSDNKGFTANQNAAIRAASAEYIFQLNNDTLLKSNAVKILYDFMRLHEDAGAAGPMILNADGSFQNISIKGSYNLWNLFCLKSGLSRLFYKSRVFGGVQLGHLDRSKIQKMEAFSGAAVMIRKKAFDELGLLDDRIIFGPDDYEFSLRLKKAGYNIYYEPAARILHYWGQTARANTPKNFALEHIGILYFYSKHYGKFNALVLRLMMFLFAIPQMFYYALRSILGINRKDSVIWRKAYFEVIKVCLGNVK
jgi:O-antigen biosynthesis protein